MNFKSISFYLSLFCFPISILAFINILYASYFDYFLSIESYFITLTASLILGFSFYFFGKNGSDIEGLAPPIKSSLFFLINEAIVSGEVNLPTPTTGFEVMFFTKSVNSS